MEPFFSKFRCARSARLYKVGNLVYALTSSELVVLSSKREQEHEVIRNRLDLMRGCTREAERVHPHSSPLLQDRISPLNNYSIASSGPRCSASSFPLSFCWICHSESKREDPETTFVFVSQRASYSIYKRRVKLLIWNLGWFVISWSIEHRQKQYSLSLPHQLQLF